VENVGPHQMSDLALKEGLTHAWDWLSHRAAGPMCDGERKKLRERYRWEIVGPNPLLAVQLAPGLTTAPPGL
jgi:hypothetical protein